MLQRLCEACCQFVGLPPYALGSIGLGNIGLHAAEDGGRPGVNLWAV